jgi:hypothetical protein
MPLKKRRKPPQVLDQHFQIRCTQADLDDWEKQAEAARMTVSAWIRMRLKEKR